ncbi:hypothetical protein BDV95DRAFT_441584, partial [Massariosphaeria phaeospora]
MSKAKRKRERRESKRTEVRKAASNARKTTKSTLASSSSSKPPPKKLKTSTTSTNAVPPTTKPTPKPTPPTHTQASQRRPIPFGTYDHILLVGEGDFSFTSSLALHHGCAHVTGTSFDSEEDVRNKYPTFDAIQSELSALTPPVPVYHSIDAGKLSLNKALRCRRDEGVDEGEGEGWDVIGFIFPHTGGLSTDVNRQVRANQALLVSFFESCLEKNPPKFQPPPKHPASSTSQNANLTPLAKRPSKSTLKRPPFLKPGGRIIVTLFDAPPYTLWNIRDLARHTGLKVLESFRFEGEEYPGYKHVRTLGAIEGGGAWKAEEREARMYVFQKAEVADDKGKRGE